MLRSIKEKTYEIIVVLVCTAVFCAFVAGKEGFHMDELLSFELANAEFNPWIVPTQPEGRLAKYVHQEIDGDTFGETLGNLADTVKDVLGNRGNSKLLSYTADIYEEPVWITSKQFSDYITVGGGDAFNYLSVYFNVKDDNHPPLHFMLLHTVSSLFQGKISPWMGCVVNMAAVIWILVLLCRVSSLLAPAFGLGNGGRRLGLMTALLYGLSAGAVATVLLIRMYGMVTLWCVLYFYLILRKWQDASFDRKNGKLILVTALGFWTQYFFLFYCLLLAAVVGVCLGRRKRRRELFCFVRSMVTAALVGVAVFPFAVQDVFSSGRGVEALGNLSQGLAGYGTRLLAFGRILIGRGAGGYSILILLLLAVFALAGVTGHKRPGKAEGGDRAYNGEEGEKAGNGEAGEEREKAGNGETGEKREKAGNGEAGEEGEKAYNGEAGEKREKAGIGGAGIGGRQCPAELLWMLLFPPAGYFLLAARMSPYLVDRYIMPIFPFAALAFMLALVWLLESIRRNHSGGRTKYLTQTVCGILILLQVWNLTCYDGDYLYKGYSRQKAVSVQYGDYPCICVYEGVGYYENLLEFTSYEKTLLLTLGELENRKEGGSIEELGHVSLLVKRGVDEDRVLEILMGKYGFCVEQEIEFAPSAYDDKVFILRKDA